MDEERGFFLQKGFSYIKVLAKGFPDKNSIAILVRIDIYKSRVDGITACIIRPGEDFPSIEGDIVFWKEEIGRNWEIGDLTPSENSVLRSVISEMRTLSNYDSKEIDAWAKDVQRKKFDSIRDQIAFKLTKLLGMDLDVSVDGAVLTKEEEREEASSSIKETMKARDVQKTTSFGGERVYLDVSLIESPTQGILLADVVKGSVLIVKIKKTSKNLSHLKRIFVSKQELDEDRILRPVLVVNTQKDAGMCDFDLYFCENIYCRASDSDLIKVKRSDIETYNKFYDGGETLESKKAEVKEQKKTTNKYAFIIYLIIVVFVFFFTWMGFFHQ